MKAICLLIGLLLAPLAAGARTAADFFASAPDKVIRLLPQSTRLDMLDYFKFGSTRPSSNAFQGEAILKALSDRVVSFEVDKGVGMQIAVLPSARQDTVLALVTTLSTPSPISSISFYDKDWNELKNTFFHEPQNVDWLTTKGKKERAEVATKLPFVPVSYSFDPDATILRAVNEAAVYLDKDEFKQLEPMLVLTKVYTVAFPKFKLLTPDGPAKGN